METDIPSSNTASVLGNKEPASDNRAVELGAPLQSEPIMGNNTSDCGCGSGWSDAQIPKDEASPASEPTDYAYQPTDFSQFALLKSFGAQVKVIKRLSTNFCVLWFHKIEHQFDTYHSVKRIPSTSEDVIAKLKSYWIGSSYNKPARFLRVLNNSGNWHQANEDKA